ncbi:MAG TPA: sulfotransferase [Bryobacteraceae bacterium]|jgi:hypothetical protein|nr:sulfotransferase [Bryobacteraceae bacterium]
MLADAQSLPFPNFFLVGAPKAGTTALYRYLDQHPAIYMSPIKEPHFFADEVRLENFADDFRGMAEARLPALREYLAGEVREKFSGGPIADWADYLKLFQCVRGETAIGEASVCCLWSETAARNIHAQFPHAKILMMLRNPVERAFSQYAHMLTFAAAPVSFADHMDAALRSTSTQMSELYPFLRFGLYAAQIERYFALFDRGQVNIHFYEDFCRAPLDVMQSIFAFLGVDAAFRPDLGHRHMEAKVPRSFWLKNALKKTGMWDVARSAAPEVLRRAAFKKRNAIRMTADDCARLANYYREDIGKLSVLLGRDLSDWLHCDL